MPAPRIFSPQGSEDQRLSRYAFAFPADAGLAVGFEALQQQVVLHLMGSPDTDRYSDEGGGMIRIMRAFLQGTSFEQTSADIYDAVSRTRQQMLTGQVNEDQDPSEQLADLVINGIERTQDRKLNTFITITSATGEVGTLRL